MALRTARVRKLLSILISCALFIFARGAIKAEEGSLPERAVNKIREEFPAVRIEESDFHIPAGWELPLTIPAVEQFFDHPLEVPLTSSGWLDRIEQAKSGSELFGVAKDIVGSTEPIAEISIPSKKENPLPKEVPPSLRGPLKKILTALTSAQPLLDAAVDSVSKENRDNFLRLNEWPAEGSTVLEQEISSRRTKLAFEGMQPFRQDELMAAGNILFRAIDEALAELQTSSVSIPKAIRCSTPHGDILIGTSGDDTYNADDLKNVVLLIEPGGKNTYRTPVAAAHEKQIRIVIDLGSDVKIEGQADDRGNAGFGVFGIGVLALPHPEGIKELKTADFSQGAGLCGIGAVLINGPCHAVANRFVQGWSVFGAGIFSSVDSSSSTYQAIKSGQGSAQVRGVGIFRHQGNDAAIEGGLVEPDPREPLGSISMCQGVGFGPRAYAGGGVGLAVVAGDRVSVKGSYFSQGCGYWHALGAFRFRGNHSKLQARRYDMGSGVHSAFGHWDLLGNSNQILNWAVGPANAWDHAVGSSLMDGDDNEIQANWGVGTAAVGSLSFSYLRTNHSRLKIPHVGFSGLFRNEVDYSIHVLDGTDNRVQGSGQAASPVENAHLMPSPWGNFRVKGTSFEGDLHLIAPEWPELPRAESIKREKVDLHARLTSAADKPPLEEVADLIDVSAAFSLDKATPREALGKLIALPDDKAVNLVALLEPAAVDQLIQLSIAIPAHGDFMAREMLSRYTQMPLQKRMTILNLLRNHRPSMVAPELLWLLDFRGSDRIRAGTLRTLGQMLNKDTGEEPGPRAILAALSRSLAHRFSGSARKTAQLLLQKARFADAFGLFSTTCDPTPDQRMDFFHSGPDDITEKIGVKAATAFLLMTEQNRARNLRRINQELSYLDQLEAEVRHSSTQLLVSTNPANVNAAVLVLGQIARPEDAAVIGPMLEHEKAFIRETTAVALGRMGTAAIPIFEQQLSSGSVRSRCLVMVGLGQTVSKECTPLLVRGLNDPEPLVRLTAITTLNNLPEVLRPEQKKLTALAKKRLPQEPDPSVRLALQLLP